MKVQMQLLCCSKQYLIIMARRGAHNLKDTFLQSIMETIQNGTVFGITVFTISPMPPIEYYPMLPLLEHGISKLEVLECCCRQCFSKCSPLPSESESRLWHISTELQFLEWLAQEADYKQTIQVILRHMENFTAFTDCLIKLALTYI